MFETTDTAGARHSSEAWKASGIDTLTWDPHHEEPAYDGAAIVTSYSLRCVRTATDSVVFEVHWHVVGAIYSGDPVRWEPADDRSLAVLRRMSGKWRLWGEGNESEQHLWFGPHISPAVALANSPWLQVDDSARLRALVTQPARGRP